MHNKVWWCASTSRRNTQEPHSKHHQPQQGYHLHQRWTKHGQVYVLWPIRGHDEWSHLSHMQAMFQKSSIHSTSFNSTSLCMYLQTVLHLLPGSFPHSLAAFSFVMNASHMPKGSKVLWLWLLCFLAGVGLLRSPCVTAENTEPIRSVSQPLRPWVHLCGPLLESNPHVDMNEDCMAGFYDHFTMTSKHSSTAPDPDACLMQVLFPSARIQPY